MLTNIQVEAFYKARIDLPAPLGENRLDGRCRTEDEAVFDSHEAPASVELHRLSVEQTGLLHPSWLGPAPFARAALGLNPLPRMRDQRRQIVAESVGEQQRGALRREHLHDLMDQTLG